MSYSPRAKRFCCESLDRIENWEEAKNSKEMYDVHHRLETKMGVSREWLKEHDLYYNRPASELIFIERSTHRRMHRTGKCHTEESKKKMSEKRKGKRTGKDNPMFGKVGTFTGKHHSPETKARLSKNHTGEQNGFYGKTHSKEFLERQSKRNSGSGNPNYKYIDPEELYQHRYVMKESYSKMAERFGISVPTIKRKISEL